MSRLYLILLFAVWSFSGLGQNNLKKYLAFAKEQFDKGDYFYALEYYNKAMELDSNTIDILWQVAETYRAYKDYRKAEYYYDKVYEPVGLEEGFPQIRILVLRPAKYSHEHQNLFL
jgi:tetratricopeptide (TPR) repeat protein